VQVLPRNPRPWLERQRRHLPHWLSAAADVLPVAAAAKQQQQQPGGSSSRARRSSISKQLPSREDLVVSE
jgi:hypothetical protein